MSSAIRQHKTKSDTQRKIQLSRDAYSLILTNSTSFSSGIHRPQVPVADRSEIFNFLLIPVRSEILKFFRVLVRPGRRTKPLGPGPIGCGPWIPVSHKKFMTTWLQAVGISILVKFKLLKWIKNEIRIVGVTKESERIHFWCAPRYKLNNCCLFVF